MNSEPWQDSTWILCDVKETCQSVRRNTWQSNDLCIYGCLPGQTSFYKHVDHILTECMLGWARAIIKNEKVAATAKWPATVVHPLQPAECSLYCFNGFRPNHLARHCQLEWHNQHSKPHIGCYKCQKKEDHTMSKCPRKQKKRGGKWVPPLPHVMKKTSLPVMHRASTEWRVVHW